MYRPSWICCYMKIGWFFNLGPHPNEHDDEYAKICRCRPGYMKLVMMILVIKDIQVSSTPKSLLPVESVLLDNCTAEHYHLKLGQIAIIIIVTIPDTETTINNHWGTCNLISRKFPRFRFRDNCGRHHVEKPSIKQSDNLRIFGKVARCRLL